MPTFAPRPAFIATLPPWLRGVVEFVFYMVERFNTNGAATRAASLTYTSLFAIVPLMTVTFATLSAFSAFDGVSTQLETFIFRNFLPATGEALQLRLRDFSEQARELTGVGVIFLVVTAFMMLVNIENAFNHIWQVTQPRRGVSRFLLYGAVLTWGPPMLAAGVASSSYLMSLPLISEADDLGLREAIFAALPALFSSVAFTLLYYLVPHTRVPLGHAIIGGAVAMAAFEGAKTGFAYFVSVASVQVVYGTFAVVPLFLTWLYLVWIIVLMGAELVRALSIREDRIDRTGAEFSQLVRLLYELYRAHEAGTYLPDGRPQKIMRGAAVTWTSLAPRLLRHGVVRQTVELGWVLGKSPEQITLASISQLLPDAIIRAPAVRGEAEWTRRFNEVVRSVQADAEHSLDISLRQLFTPSEPEEDEEVIIDTPEDPEAAVRPARETVTPGTGTPDAAASAAGSGRAGATVAMLSSGETQ